MRRRSCGDPKYELEIRWSPEDGAYVVSVPELPGCMTHGATINKAIAMARDAISEYLQSIRSRGLPVPPPLAERNFSGRIPLRLDPVLHRDLTIKARSLGVSLNHYIQQKLRQSS